MVLKEDCVKGIITFAPDGETVQDMELQPFYPQRLED